MAAKLIGAGLATIALAGAAVGVGLIFVLLVLGLLGLFHSCSTRLELVLLVLLFFLEDGFPLSKRLGLFALMMALIFLYAFNTNLMLA